MDILFLAEARSDTCWLASIRSDEAHLLADVDVATRYHLLRATMGNCTSRAVGFVSLSPGFRLDIYTPWGYNDWDSRYHQWCR